MSYLHVLLVVFAVGVSPILPNLSPASAQDSDVQEPATDEWDGVNLDDDPYKVETRTLEISDPLESVNRGVFWFNDRLDVYVLEPLALGYNWAVPDSVQHSVGNFFDTIRYPTYIVSDAIKLDADRALVDTGRFIVNATIGFLGFFDVATELGLQRRVNDIGLALGSHGVNEGPYIVLPILGPSSVRDAVGEIFNFALDPATAVQFSQIAQAGVITTVAGGVRTVNRRSCLLEDVKSAKEGSLDYYLFVQSAYMQYRRGLVKGEEDSSGALFDVRPVGSRPVE